MPSPQERCLNPNLRHQFETASLANAMLDPSLLNPTHAPDTRPLAPAPKPVSPVATPPHPKTSGVRLDDIKTRIHQEILSLMDWQRMESMAPDRLRTELKALTEELMATHKLALNETERRLIIQSIQDEMMGRGPIAPLLSDPTVSDILVNGPFKV